MAEFDKSREAGITGRVKALLLLLSPFLAFAAIVVLALLYARFHPAHFAESREPAPIGADDWLSSENASSSGASVDVTRGLQEIPGKGATTVTTYTVTGKF